MAGPDALVETLRTRANQLGFDAFGIAAAAPAQMAERLNEALQRNWHGDMDWMRSTSRRRADPNALWPGAKSAIMLGLSYAPKNDPMQKLADTSAGNISVYAGNRDYHRLIKGRLKEIAGLLARRTGADVKVFVDTAPLMEKPLAAEAGLGWQGKHTVLVSREHGSWLFLGAILTSADLPPDRPHAENCGTCRNCLDICPTNAFPAPFQLDARKCLAYLSVEHKAHIPRRFRAPMGNRIYGCDDCLAVCPWNKFARTTREATLRTRPELEAPALADLLRLDDPRFRALFSGSPVKRIGYERFLRNVVIAAGNSQNPALLPALEQRLADGHPLIRAAAIWAVRRLATDERIAHYRAHYLPDEKDFEIAGEWDGELVPPLEPDLTRNHH